MNPARYEFQCFCFTILKYLFILNAEVHGGRNVSMPDYGSKGPWFDPQLGTPGFFSFRTLSFVLDRHPMGMVTIRCDRAVQEYKLCKKDAKLAVGIFFFFCF